MVGSAVVTQGDGLGVAFSGSTSFDEFLIDDAWCVEPEGGWFGERQWESPIAPTFVCPER